MLRTRAIGGGIVVGTVLLLSTQALAQDDYLARRQKMMKGISAAAKEVKAAVTNKDYPTVAVKVKDLADTFEMSSFAKHWPHDSADVKSKAKPEIWQNWDDFMKQAHDAHLKSLALVAAANSKDDAKVDAAYKSFGSTCGNCHKPYRAEKAR